MLEAFAELRHEQKNPLTFTEMFNMNPLEKFALSREIAKHDGRIRIIVHPYFMEDRTFVGAQLYKYEAFMDGIERVIASESASGLPLFIFEEADAIPILRSRLQSTYTGDLAKRIVLVPTQPGSPEPRPSFETYDLNTLEEPDIFDSHMRRLTKSLKDVGVKTVLLNGTMLTVGFTNPTTHSDEDDIWFESVRTQLTQEGIPYADRLLFGRCVGTTMSVLADHFTVEVSALTFPDNLLTIKTIQKPAGRHTK